jgi:hypothetical protein
MLENARGKILIWVLTMQYMLGDRSRGVRVRVITGVVFVGLAIAALSFGMRRNCVFSATPESVLVSVPRLDAIRHNDLSPVPLLETIDNSVLIPILRSQASALESREIGRIADEILRVYSNVNSKELSAGQTGGSSEKQDEIRLAIEMLILGNVLKGIAQANEKRLQESKNSFDAALRLYDEMTEKAELMNASKQDKSVASRAARILYLPRFILHASTDDDKSLSRTVADNPEAQKDKTRKFMDDASVFMEEVPESSQEGRTFNDAVAFCWKQRMWGELVVTRSGETFEAGKKNLRTSDCTNLLTRALAQVYREFRDLHATFRERQDSLTKKELPEFFKDTRFDFNRDNKFDVYEAQDLHRQFEKEFPLTAIREIREQLRRFRVSHQAGSLTDQDIIDKCTKSFGGVYYDFRGDGYGTAGDVAVERRLNMLMEEEFRNIDPLPNP